jgi:hypothetical protein
MKLTTKMGAACALALGAVSTLSALGGHPTAAQTPTVVPFVNASNPTNSAQQAANPAVSPPAQPVVPDTGTAQSGDQNAPDTPGKAPASETTNTSEAGSAPESSAAPGDGSGGHQDSGANVDHQFVGSE